MKCKSLCVFVMCFVLMFTVISCHFPNDEFPQDTVTAETQFGHMPDTNPEASQLGQPEHVTLIDGTLSTEQYTLTADTSGCYVNFFDEYTASEEDKLACMLMEIYFDSVSDLVNSFQTNRFEENERVVMQASFPQNEKGIQICDLNHLFDVTLPEDTIVSSIALHGGTYDFFLTCELFDYASVSYVDDWTVSKDRMYDWSKGATITRDEESTFDGVPCRIVEYTNSAETYRDIFIETEQDGKKADMVLRYLLEDRRVNPERVSDTAPWTVKMYCEDDGVYYKVSIDELTETPTYEWLSSFGLTPYVPVSGDLAAE